MKNSKDIHKNHRKRLRERFERDGALSFESHELLELFLFDVIPRSNTNPTAHRLLDKFGSLYGVFSAPKCELVKIRGVGSRTADYILSAAEKFRSNVESEFLLTPIASFENAANYLIWHTLGKNESVLTVIMLDRDMKIIKTSDYTNTELSSALSAAIGECTSVSAAKIIIGYKGNCDSKNELIAYSEEFEKHGIILCDTIVHHGLEAESFES